jgi:hypothetical protein
MGTKSSHPPADRPSLKVSEREDLPIGRVGGDPRQEVRESRLVRGGGLGLGGPGLPRARRVGGWILAVIRSQR